jgi:hypothetical protein
MSDMSSKLPTIAVVFSASPAAIRETSRTFSVKRG